MERLCPSAPATAQGARVFGVVGGRPGARRVAYLEQTIDVTDGIVAATAPVSPNEVLRTSAACAGDGCSHFDGRNCTLVSRITALLAPAVDRPPPCAIRRDCRWWHQEGVSACLRCPQVVTASRAETAEMERAAAPPT